MPALLLKVMDMKKVLKAIAVLIGLILLIDGIFLSMVANFNFGNIAAFILGAVFVAVGAIPYKVINVIPKWIRYIVIFGLVCAVVMITFLAVYGNTDTSDYTEDAVVVLGAGIKGETPTLPLVRRLDKAVEFYERNNNVLIVVSGGQGFQEDITEALAMERYLVKKGVPAKNIIKEENATSTYENFLYSKEILDKHFNGDYNTAFITNDFHIYRASRLAKLAGIENTTHISGITEWYTLPVNYIRECFAVIKLWVFRS